MRRRPVQCHRVAAIRRRAMNRYASIRVPVLQGAQVSAFALWSIVLPLVLAQVLVVVAHPVAPTLMRNCLVFTGLMAAAQALLMSGRGVFALVGSMLPIAAFGSVGMAVGELLDRRPRMSCCMSVFDAGEFFSWPTLLMCLFCYVGSLVMGSCGSANHRKVTCGWLSVPMMYIGMCLAGQYLSPALKVSFGLYLGMHWAMFLGMVAGHVVDMFVQKIVLPIGSRLFLKHQNFN